MPSCSNTRLPDALGRSTERCVASQSELLHAWPRLDALVTLALQEGAPRHTLHSVCYAPEDARAAALHVAGDDDAPETRRRRRLLVDAGYGPRGASFVFAATESPRLRRTRQRFLWALRPGASAAQQIWSLLRGPLQQALRWQARLVAVRVLTGGVYELAKRASLDDHVAARASVLARAAPTGLAQTMMQLVAPPTAAEAGASGPWSAWAGDFAWALAWRMTQTIILQLTPLVPGLSLALRVAAGVQAAAAAPEGGRVAQLVVGLMVPGAAVGPAPEQERALLQQAAEKIFASQSSGMALAQIVQQALNVLLRVVLTAGNFNELALAAGVGALSAVLARAARDTEPFNASAYLRDTEERLRAESRAILALSAPDDVPKRAAALYGNTLQLLAQDLRGAALEDAHASAAALPAEDRELWLLDLADATRAPSPVTVRLRAAARAKLIRGAVDVGGEALALQVAWEAGAPPAA